MRKKYLFCIIFFTVIFLGATTILTNLDEIRFGLSLVQLYRSTASVKDLYIPSGNNKAVENPLEKLTVQEDIVDIEVANEDNKEINKEDIQVSENGIESNNEIVDDNLSIGKSEKESKSFPSIVSSYNYSLKSLEDEVKINLLKLIESAFNDYASRAYTNTELAKKYLEEGTKLETSTDAKFYTLLSEFESDLSQNSYSTDLVASFEDYYIQLKEQIKLDIFNKGLELVEN